MAIKHDLARGRFYYEKDKVLGEMTYSFVEDGVISIDHTYVDYALRGMGIGKSLMDSVVAFARNENFKVVSSCSFATALTKRFSDEYSDVL